MSANNRVLLASPCYGKVDPEILEDWMRLAYHCGRRMPDYEFFIGIKTKSEQFRARNMIVEGAQQHNCDWILMLDDDMVIDALNEGHEAYRIIEKLLSHDKDICGVLYYQRGGECAPVLMAKLGEKGYRFLRDDEITHDLQRVDVAGGGCLLIKTRVFDRIAFPYFEPEHQYGTDVQLCRKAAEKGFEVWADTSIELGHLRNEKALVTSRNKHQFQRETQHVGGGKTSFVASDVYNRLLVDVLEYTKYESREDAYHHAEVFLKLRRESTLSDAEWYREFPRERVARQLWFNTENSVKKMMTQYIIGAIAHHQPLRILDFGCGIGIPAFTLAEKGHNVTALDVRGTGTLEFLKWRAAKHGANITFIESEGGVPKLKEHYDVIIAMDCLEHFPNWPDVLAVLSKHLREDGLLFSNNAVMDDMTQPEHYECHPRDFIKACVDCSLMPFTQISYTKKAAALVEGPVMV